MTIPGVKLNPTPGEFITQKIPAPTETLSPPAPDKPQLDEAQIDQLSNRLSGFPDGRITLDFENSGQWTDVFDQTAPEAAICSFSRDAIVASPIIHSSRTTKIFRDTSDSSYDLALSRDQKQELRNGDIVEIYKPGSDIENPIPSMVFIVVHPPLVPPSLQMIPTDAALYARKLITDDRLKYANGIHTQLQAHRQKQRA